MTENIENNQHIVTLEETKADDLDKRTENNKNIIKTNNEYTENVHNDILDKISSDQEILTFENLPSNVLKFNNVETSNQNICAKITANDGRIDSSSQSPIICKPDEPLIANFNDNIKIEIIQENEDFNISKTDLKNQPINSLKCSQTTDSITSNQSSLDLRRNSLPDPASLIDISSKTRTDVPNLESDRSKIAPDIKNLSEVVKNVHGLFSMVGGNLKNAYKPVERNFGGIMMATQKNLSLAKGVYFSRSEKIEEDSGKSVAFDNLGKYSTLNLNNENTENLENLFSKCSPKNATEDEKSPNKNEKKSPVSGSIKNNEMVENLQSQKTVEAECIETLEKNSETSSAQNGNENSEDEDKIKLLEKTIIEQNKQLHAYQAANAEKDILLKELDSKINNLKLQATAALKERDGAVMKYASSERIGLEAIRAKDLALAAEKAAKTEVSLLTQRLRQEHAHRSRICAMLDDKSHEVIAAQKEVSRVREELQSCEVKLKWAQNKLSTEMDSHKETTSLVERLTQQVSQNEGMSIQSNNSPAHSMGNDAIMKEKEAIIIMEKHERERAEGHCKQLNIELQQLKSSLAVKTQEVRDLKAKIDETLAEAESLRTACAELREQAAKDCERLAAAQARGARTDTLAAHLQQEQEKTSNLQAELDAERMSKSEAQAEVELRARRETELLKQTERLTEASVRLQARCSEAEAKALALSVENASLREAAENASKLAASEREGRSTDAKALAAAAARHAKAEKEARSQADAAEGEARAKDAKHAAVIKELKREIIHWKKKCEKFECDDNHRHISLPASSHRTGSCSSLSSYEGSANQNHISSETSETIAENQILQVHVPDRQQLVERIVSLQRASARRGERVDFLEDHCAQLTRELQQKTKLLRELLAKSPAGALTSVQSDKAKAEITKHGGIMSSVYGSQVTDETMTLELSLEMNSKLQSVLEDALLKNITLKENMDTLGDEITRLKEELETKTKK